MTYDTQSGLQGLQAQRTITAFFDTRDDAQEAVDALRAEGVESSAISMIEGSRPGSMAGDAAADRPYREEGFWASLANLFMPDDDRYTYAEGLRRGGYLVTVTTSAADYDAILEILDREGTVDIDERAAAWRSSGWTGTGSAGSAPDMPAATRGPDLGTAAATGSSLRSDLAQGSDRALSAGREEEEVIPIAEEQLRIGKREINEGRIRVRSYVVETPVEEDVSLREERVSVQRRPVDRPITSEADPFQERTIEVEQRGEEAVVSKDTRIKEELVVGKTESFRTEKVADTVRHTEVEVSDARQAGERLPDDEQPPLNRRGTV
jgi:uncharacterized protein (TIGR02271 family)